MRRPLALLAFALVLSAGCVPPPTLEIDIPDGAKPQLTVDEVERLVLPRFEEMEARLGVRLAEPRLLRISFHHPGEMVPLLRPDGTQYAVGCGFAINGSPSPHGCWVVEAQGTFVFDDDDPRGRRGHFWCVDSGSSGCGSVWIPCWGDGAHAAIEELCPEAARRVNEGPLP